MAILPRVGKSANFSIQTSFWGIIFTKQHSPILIYSGFSSVTFPVFLSILHKISSNFPENLEVWHEKIGEYPFFINPGWLMIRS